MKPSPDASLRHEIPLASCTLQRNPAAARIRSNASSRAVPVPGEKTGSAGAAKCAAPLRLTTIAVGLAGSPSASGTRVGAPVIGSVDPPAAWQPACSRGTMAQFHRPLGLRKK
ncbi:Uncharacterised protein [Mycolicibacterium thermoresistibile]|nr:Uncharacterised protein [Mycolicibacterium thermoresistibile]